MSDLAAKLSPGTQLPGTSTTVPGTKHHSAASATGEARTLPALGSVKTPDFKTGTLAGLLNVSEAVAKHDTAFTGILSKIVDTIRSLDPNELKRERSDLHLVFEYRCMRLLTGNLVLDDGRPFESYVLDGWEWNRAKFRTEGRPLNDLVDSFQQVCSSVCVTNLVFRLTTHTGHVGARHHSQAKAIELQSRQRSITDASAKTDVSLVLLLLSNHHCQTL